ncbi:HPP family protein [Aquirufa beregesia]
MPKAKVVKRKIKRGNRISQYVIYKETVIDQKENFLSFLGAFLGVGIIAFCQKQILNENILLIGSFAASSVLIFLICIIT